jgi:hypothetical protein
LGAGLKPEGINPHVSFSDMKILPYPGAPTDFAQTGVRLDALWENSQTFFVREIQFPHEQRMNPLNQL